MIDAVAEFDVMLFAVTVYAKLAAPLKFAGEPRTPTVHVPALHAHAVVTVRLVSALVEHDVAWLPSGSEYDSVTVVATSSEIV